MRRAPQGWKIPSGGAAEREQDERRAIEHDGQQRSARQPARRPAAAEPRGEQKAARHGQDIQRQVDGKPLHAERAQAVIERQQEDRLQHDGREKACPDGNAPRPARQHERRGKHGPVQQLQVLPHALVHR